jgi:hypothetical protein
MADLKLAAQTAIVAKLSATAAVTNLAPVYQHVPDDTQPPVVVIGDISAAPVGGKGGALDLLDVEIITMVRAPGREHLTPLRNAVRDALDEQALPTQAGVALSVPVFAGDEDTIEDDGNTYIGTQRFSLYVQPA